MPLNSAHAVLAVGFLVLLMNSGSRFSIGLMLKPMVEDLDWKRSTLSLAVTVFMVVSAVALPVVGRLVDRFGPQRILITATVLSALSLGAMSFVRSPVEAIILYGLVLGLGSAGTSVTPIAVMITRWFPERLGMANSIAISGMGVGQLVVILALASQLENIGWRGAFVALGVANAVFVLPLLALRAGRPTGDAGAAVPAGAAAQAGIGDALRTGRLWRLLIIYAICGFQDFFVATHVVAFARDEGVSALLAGNLLAFMGLAGLIGVLLAGGASDRFGPARPTALCFALRIGVFALILANQDLPAIAVFALLYGTTFWITAPLTVVFVRQGFGLARLGALTGLVTMVHHAAGGLGAYLGAALFDAQGSYQGSFWWMLILSVVALAVIGAGGWKDRSPDRE